MPVITMLRRQRQVDPCGSLASQLANLILVQ